MSDTPTQEWGPTATLEILRLRARLLARVRRFFAQRGVLEVETPMLSAAAATAPYLDSFSVAYRGPRAPGSGRLYLHTSPEFPMKRLLAAGSGSVYQLCRAFRDGEAGARHNPEFTLLEWYRVGFSLPQLSDEVERLLRSVLAGIRELPAAQRCSYRELFMRYAQLDGLTATVDELRACLATHGHPPPAGLATADLDSWRDLVLTQVIEPRLTGLMFVSDYPASQASLARVRPGDPPVAARFECYLDGMELANGFHELADAAEQAHRFAQDLAARARDGRPVPPPDTALIEALRAGLPDCCGVALGFDRLLMAAAGVERIEAVLAFPIGRA
ncbi:MAG: EF-P lysine aminoacylase EpmA [Gammaproteobacteria bacterium]